MPPAWENELADFLNELSAVQTRSLDVLSRKREALATLDLAALDGLASEEQDLVSRLGRCLERRKGLLARASDEGRPADSIRSLAGSLPGARQTGSRQKFDEASARARMLWHHSLTNWLLAQRTLLHLAQLLEIIATGGRMEPTYQKEGRLSRQGALVDEVA